MMTMPIRWPFRRAEPLELDRTVEIKTAAALATVDVELANLRAVLLEIDETVVGAERGEPRHREQHGRDDSSAE